MKTQQSDNGLKRSEEPNIFQCRASGVGNEKTLHTILIEIMVAWVVGCGCAGEERICVQCFEALVHFFLFRNCVYYSCFESDDVVRFKPMRSGWRYVASLTTTKTSQRPATGVYIDGQSKYYVFYEKFFNRMHGIRLISVRFNDIQWTKRPSLLHGWFERWMVPKSI